MRALPARRLETVLEKVFALVCGEDGDGSNHQGGMAGEAVELP